MKKVNTCLCVKAIVSPMLLLCISSPLAHGQSSIAGRITGTVNDPSGAVIPGVQVTVTNTATGVAKDATTNGAGFYTVETLQSGLYTVTMRKEGFQGYTTESVKLSPGDALTVNATLQVGEPTTQVTVTAAPVAVQTASGDKSGVIAGDQIQEILLNGRSYLGLAYLIPGVNSGVFGAGSGNTSTQTFLSVNGMSGAFGLVTYDGAANSNLGSKGTPMVAPPLDSVAEFRILKGNYSAKYGSSGSAEIQLQSKTGTRAFHGSVYEYLRNEALNASDYFAGINPATGKPNKTPLKQNNFGWSFGGPFYIPGKYNTEKNKTFFFVNQEWRVNHQGLTLRGTMIPEAMRNGDFTNSPTFLSGTGLKFDAAATQFMSQLHPGVNCLPDVFHLNPACFDQNAVKLMNEYWPLPNNPSGGFLNYINPGVDIFHQRDDTIRVDHYFSPKLWITGRFNYETVADTPPALTTAGTNPAPTTGQTFPNVTAMNSMLRLTWTPGPSLVNQFTVVDTYDKTRGEAVNVTTPADVKINHYFPLEIADKGRNRIPNVSLARGYAGYGPALFPIDASDNMLTFADDVTKVVHNHIIQAGTLVAFGLKRQNTFANTSGTFSFSGVHTNDPVADYLLGLDASYNQRSYDRKGYIRYRGWDLYIQDDWKVTPRLTLNLGVRQMYLTSDKIEGNQYSDFNPNLWNPDKAPLVQPNGTFLLDAQGNPVTAAGTIADPLNGIVYAWQDNVPDGIFLTPTINLEPRFGFAWDMFGNGKTAVRGGYGLGHNTLSLANYSSLANTPYVQSITLLNGTFTSPTAGVPGAQTPQTLNYLGPPGILLHFPYIQTWSLTVERQVLPNGVLSVAYAGSGARKLTGDRDINFPLPVAAPSISNPSCLDTGQTIPSGGFDFDPCLNRGLVSGTFTRPYQGWSSLSAAAGSSNKPSAYRGTSNYHSLQTGFVYRAPGSLTLTTAYTWSKVLTDVSARGTSGNQISGAGAQNPRNFKAEYGRAGWDRQHVFTAGYVWEIPWLKTRKDLVGKVVGGWQLSGMTVFQTGLAFSPGNAVLAGLASRPNVAGPVSYPKTVQKWFSTESFVRPAFGFFGNAGAGIINGPGEQNWNFALAKNFRLTETLRLQFRGELFNIFNHPNFLGISTALGAGNYGQVTSALPMRVVQFGLRLDF